MGSTAEHTDHRSPIAVVRAYCNAWMAGDTMAVLSLYHDDLTLHWPGRHRLAGTHEGQTAAVDALLALQAVTNRVPVEIVDVMAGDTGVAVIVRERWSADLGDPAASIEITRVLVFTVADGKLLSCRVFEFDQPAVDDWLARLVEPGSA